MLSYCDVLLTLNDKDKFIRFLEKQLADSYSAPRLKSKTLKVVNLDVTPLCHA